LLEEAIQFGAIKQATVEDDGSDSLGVGDVGERVGIEDDDVGETTGLELSESIGVVAAEEARRIYRGGLKRFHGTETGADE
jgi:hypothetical protein